jgi:hypothetical protein
MGQGALYPIGSFISKVGLFGYFIFSFFFIIDNITKTDLKIHTYKYLFIFGFLNATYFLFLFTTGEHIGIKLQFMRSISYTLLSFFIFYHLSVKSKITSKHLILLFYVLLGFAIMNYIRQEEIIEGTKTLQNNAIYGIVMLFPFLFLMKNKTISLIISSMMYLFTIYSLKRGAVITGSVLFLIYLHFLLFTSSKKNSFVNKLLIRSLILIFIIFISYYFIGLILDNDQLLWRFQNIEVDRGGQREYIFYETFWGWFNFDKPLNFLFGYGFAGSTLFAFGGTAHNDFLEVVSNFGLIGMITLIGIWYSLYKYLRFKNLDIKSKYILASVLMAWIIDSQYQQFYNSLYSFSMMLLLGYVIGIEKSNLMKNHKADE